MSQCNNDNTCPTINECYYDNCGCLNPTTWQCVTLPGNLQYIGVTNSMTGLQVLQAINSTIGALVVPSSSSADKFVKVDSSDTTSNYLSSKLISGTYTTSTIVNSGLNEQLRFDVNLPSVISTDTNNSLEIGTDNKLRVIVQAPLADISVVGGSGVTVTGTGPSSDPFVVSTNASISAARSCFDGIWRAITLISITDPNLTYVSGAPSYRIRFDGSIEFKGSATYTANFGVYSSSTRTITATIGNIPTNCVTITEQAGVADLKAITYIDTPQASADQIVQQYGYVIRKSTQNIILQFQSSYTNPTSKTIVVTFDGAISHPNF